MTDYLPTRIYVNEIGNRIPFGLNTWYYLQVLTPETIKLLDNTKIKITKDWNGKNMLFLEITEVVLAHCNIFNNDYQQDSRVLYTSTSCS